MNYARTLGKVIERANESFKVIMLTGMGQVGKTTLLRDLAVNDRVYLTMDDPRTLQIARDDPYPLFESHKLPILIGEVQYAPELFPHSIIIGIQTKLKST
ncbi:MAG: AAA family ATPase [Synergistaceae bacterium]|nr:AAA family ATPase [Synergistaceae bacterium]